VGRLYLSNFNSPKKEMTYAIATVTKNIVNRTVSFENELVPLNGRICQYEHWAKLTPVTNQALGCHYFPPGPQLPPQSRNITAIGHTKL